ncbi:hypothetical protein KRP22_013602 [Phytophthora ramorum]|nr:hypothetical protein KRP22_11220 [Phytophthora ramorum]
MWSFFSSSSNALHRHPEFPLQLLQDAIETRDERKVWRVLREQRIRNELIQSTTTHKVPRDPQQQKVNVITCVQAAVLSNMPRVVFALYRYNPADIRLATCEVETCSRGKTDVVRRPGPVRPEFDEIAALYRRDCIWERIQIVFLMRYAPDRSAMKRGLVRLNIVAELPDAVFRIVAEFLKPKFNDAEEVQKERFKTVLNLSSW